jgi:hypothetical protein
MKGQLREGLTAEEAAVLTYAIASPDTFRQLRERGWFLEPGRGRDHGHAHPNAVA